MVSIYWDNERRCRQITKRISYFIALNQSVFVAIFFFSIYCLFSGEFDITAIDLPIKFAVPFETNNTMAWYTLWLIESNIGISYGVSVVAGTSYFVCCCIYIGTICDHFCKIQSKIKFIESPTRTRGNFQKLHRETKKLLVQAIDIHVNGFE